MIIKHERVREGKYFLNPLTPFFVNSQHILTFVLTVFYAWNMEYWNFESLITNKPYTHGVSTRVHLYIVRDCCFLIKTS